MKFKLKYKKWMKVITVIFVVAITLSIISLYVTCVEPILDDILPDGVLSIIIELALILFLGYGVRCMLDKVTIDSDIGNVKIYSIESIFRRSTYIDDIEKIIVQKNSDMKYSWIEDDALIITLVERHSRVRFPLSESDWEQFRSAHKISTKEVLYCDEQKRK